MADQVLPDLLAQHEQAHLTLLTPSAPGLGSWRNAID